MKFVSRPRKVGGSVMVSIPREVLKEEGIVVGHLTEFYAKKLKKKSFFGIAKGLGSMTKEDKWNTNE